MNKLVGSLVGVMMLGTVVSGNADATESGGSEYTRQEFQLAKANFLADRLIFQDARQQFIETRQAFRAGEISRPDFIAARTAFGETRASFQNARNEWQEVRQEYRGERNNAVPIPGTHLLFGGGFAGFAAWRWKAERLLRFKA